MSSEFSDEFLVTIDNGSPYADGPPSVFLVTVLMDVHLRAEDVKAELLHAVGEPVNYLYEARRSEHSWGGDGSGTRIVLSLGDWLIQGAAFEALKSLLIAMAARTRSEGSVEHPLDRAEAIGRARFILESRFQIDGDSLDLIEDEEHVGHGWRLQLRSADRSLYEVELVEAEGLVYVVRVLHRAGEPPDEGQSTN
jgi:hypothetical protein